MKKNIIKKGLFILFIFFYFPVTAKASGIDAAKIQNALELQINNFRSQNKLQKLDFKSGDKEIKKAAETRTKECAQIGDVSHVRPNGKLGPTILDKKYNRAENLAVVCEVRGMTEEEIAEAIMDGWINSPDHKAVLLDQAKGVNRPFEVGAVAVYKKIEKGEEVFYVCLLVRDDR